MAARQPRGGDRLIERLAFILAAVERHVKERLVGAAVLVAAAVILIPEMLSGPSRRESADAATERDGAFKTYTIDLNRPPGSPAVSAPVIEESAPPPETRVDVPAATRGAEPESSAPAAAENASSEPQALPESRIAESAPPVVSRTADPAPVARTPQPTASSPRSGEANIAPPSAAKPGVPTSRGWAVQLGSFSSRATAERMTKDFSGLGYDAFVMPVQSGGSTLYRVRIGPFAERAAADDALATIRKRVANAAVVAHP